LFLGTVNIYSQQTVVSNVAKDFEVELTFSTKGGFYNEEIDLELFSPGARIYYTADGTSPTRRSKRYKTPLKINATTPIRAIAYKGKYKSEIIGHTYFINEPESSIPVVSIQITPDILFDPETGIYMQGKEADEEVWSLPGANFWSRREKDINTEIFESDGKCVFRSPTGFRMFGGMSRLFPQKSMTLVARDDYGKKRIKHKLFGKEGLNKFKFLVLRNSGSDFGKSHFRDAFMTSLLEDWDIEKQSYRPSHVYINGKYWGMYNIREKVNRYFLEDHCDIDRDSLDLMEHQRNRKRGSRKHYFNMLDYIAENDLADPANYAYVKTQMDVQNFMDYKIAQIYFDNQDAGGNIKYWRPQTPDGKWRWIIYDTDWGFGLHDDEAYENNSIAFHTREDGPFWPNPPWSTFLLRNLLKNKEFQDKFINRFADYINTTFDTERALSKINEMQSAIEPEIPRQLKRWKLSEKKWRKEIDVMREFAVKRPAHMRQHLQEFFEMGEEVNITLQTEGGGKITINENIHAHEEPLEAIYFNNHPIKLKAVPNYGYRFSHWEGIKTDKKAFTLKLRRNKYNIKAVFEPYIHPLADKVIINEINCNFKKTGDWLEIYNNSEETINMEGWVLTDLKNEFRFPKVSLQPKNYLTVCQNLKKFQKVFPDQFRIIGNTGFGFNKHKEDIQLFSNQGEAIDSIGYILEPRDSAFTLSLLLPSLENSDLENWDQTNGIGTPNSANPYYLESSVRVEQERWIRFGTFIGIIMVLMLLIMVKRLQIK